MEDSPQFDEEVARAVIGKRVLVGVTHLNRSEEVLGLEQFHGRIIRATLDEGIIVLLDGTEDERWLPPDLSRLEPARPGEYRLKSTGEVVVDPDYVSMWQVYPPSSRDDV